MSAEECMLPNPAYILVNRICSSNLDEVSWKPSDLDALIVAAPESTSQMKGLD